MSQMKGPCLQQAICCTEKGLNTKNVVLGQWIRQSLRNCSGSKGAKLQRLREREKLLELRGDVQSWKAERACWRRLKTEGTL
eukprot:467865-Amphidinium_carterae.1